jgi:hypothetical protein
MSNRRNAMQHIKMTIDSVELGAPVLHEGLIMCPLLRPDLLGPDLLGPDYLTLDEALAAGVASVSEVSHSGSVPELLFRNRGDKAVFLLDGEELVGAKQNRILNISILAPAHKDTVIPVSCVEAGRWSHRRPDFTTAPRTQFAASRARRSADVSEDIVTSGGRRSDQGRVWQDISVKMASLGSRSPTQAVEDAFVDHEDRLKQFVGRMKAIVGQVGAVFAIGGRVVGAELFDCQETCAVLLPKVIRSYALDAIDPRYGARRPFDGGAPRRFLKSIAAAATREAPAVGEGSDVRFDTASGIAGGALLARDRIVHLVAFAMQRAAGHSRDRVYRRRRY